MHSSSALLVAASVLGANACSVLKNVEMTFYGYPDNSPPGPATAYDCGGRNGVAGGTGTYDDPLTFASNDGEFTVCQLIYAPYLKKYLRMEDDCAQCDSDWNSGIYHIDVWTGSNTSNGGTTQINCEDDLTPDAKQQIVLNPASTYEVDTQALFSSGTCYTSHTYSGNAGSNYCGSASTTTTTAASSACQTGCSWSGHCIGCSCETYDDCSDDYVCTNGLCANP